MEFDKGRLLVTSALPYANGPIHIGQLAGAYLPADIFVRYCRLKKRDVIYICGTDEHGVPITLTAEKEGVPPKNIVDKYYGLSRDSFEKFGISFDNYSRTSLPIHHQTSQEFFKILHKKGILKEKEIKQYFCGNCSRFLADRYIEGTCPHCSSKEARGDQCDSCGKWLDQIDLIDPLCKICGSSPTIRTTRHWYLPLKDFQSKVKQWLDTKNDWKDNVKNFCYGWIREGLEDRAVTRDLDWGVKVPLNGAEGKVLYVWFDAPIGYISSTKEWAEKRGNPREWKKYWMDPDTKLIHFIGKDNIVFHAIFFPVILMGVGDYVLPSQIPANEFLNLEGKKLSTSRNWAVWLHEYLENFDPDSLRYTLAINSPETKDTDFSWKDFQSRNNNELADIIGNFINRSLKFIVQYYEGKIPEPGPFDNLDERMVREMKETPLQMGAFFDKFQIRSATRRLLSAFRFANKYFNDKEPWITRTENPEICATALYLCAQMVKTLAISMSPVLPFSAEKVWKMLGMERSLKDIKWDDMGEVDIPAGHKIGIPEILFTKIEDDAIEREVVKLRETERESASKEERKKMEKVDLIDHDTFMKVDLRVAKVEAAERVPETKKLLKIDIKLGDERRQIVAGLGD
ncbi:MAG: methionine--tRNA ligase, partial [Fidelibacterota bacterium]